MIWLELPSDSALALYNRGSLLGSYGEFLWTPLLSPTSSLLTGQRLDFHQLADYHASHTTEDLFHNDETGWKVFEIIEGKTGYRWWLWVTQSRSVVYYILAPSRSGDIPIKYFSGLDKHLEQVIVVCDRYKGYIRLAREIPQIILAFCWAHVRRPLCQHTCRL